MAEALRLPFDVIGAVNLYVDHVVTWGPGRTTVLLAFLTGDYADQEVAAKYGMKHKTVSARRVELWRNGYLEPYTMRKQQRQRARVWRLTTKGRAAAVRLRGEVTA